MVPDTATKWVLSYEFENIHDTAAGTVTNIRGVLTRAKFRWQEISVTSSNVEIGTGASSNVVTITLPEQLLPGLQWGMYFPAGTFEDTNGNTAAALGAANAGVTATASVNSPYWFWSKGVQKPIVRVDRKSYDARTADDLSGRVYYQNNNNYNNPLAPNQYPAANVPATEDFNTVAYRIETETKNARLFYNTIRGIHHEAAEEANPTTYNYYRGGAYTVPTLMTGRATLTAPPANISDNASINWEGPKKPAANENTSQTGTWIRRNVIFRYQPTTASQATREYNLMMKDGNIRLELPTYATYFTGDNTGNSEAAAFGGYYGLRSFNRDAQLSDLRTIIDSPAVIATISYTGTSTSGSFTGLGTQRASKNYVAAEARIDHSGGGTFTATYTSLLGSEGVFKTVVAIYLPGMTALTDGATQFPLFIVGTNVRSGAPTIAGFPLKDQAVNFDARYAKMFWRSGYDTRRYIWVTTEIVSPWYSQLMGGKNGRGQSYQGDAGEVITAGYGDFAYGYNVAGSGSIYN
jgi:hypothetical protein